MSKKLKRFRKGARTSTMERLERREMLAAHIVGSTTSYATIQAAVNAAAPGATINVDAGTYNETVDVTKSLTIRGAQAGVDARNTRGAESIVYATQTVFYVTGNDVTIDGFTIEGNDADIGAAQGAGVLMAPSIHGTHVLNNIIQSNVTGVYLSNNSNTDLCLIQHNLIQNNFEANNNWVTKQENGSRGIYTDGTVSGGYLTNVLIDSNRIYNSNFGGGDEDEGIIALQALTAGKQFNVTISNNYLGSESKALLATNVTNLSFIGNTVTKTNDGSSGPVRFEGNANVVNVQYNSIFGNSGPGVAADSSGVAGDSSGFVVNYNNIYQNDGIGVLVIASVYDGPLIAVGDYWGSSNGPSGDGPGTGQAVWANGNSGHGVTPKGAAGGTVTFSPWATALIDITKIPVPAAPGALSATVTSSTSISLAWTAQMSTATSQLIQRSTDGVNFTTIATVPPLLNAFVDTGVTSGTKYYYRVEGSNATGNSSPSNAVSVVPPVYAPPAAPTALQANGVTSSSAGLIWTAPAVTFGIVGYNIYRNGVLVGNSTATSYLDTSVAANTSYTYSVTTLDNLGAESAPTSGLSVKTLAVGTGLFATFYKDTTLTTSVLTRVDPTVNFSWNGVSPGTNVPATNFSAKWVGQFVAPTTETYTFSTTSDDGARLWVNGQELVNDWTAHSSTTDLGTIALVAGQSYSIELDYYQGGGADLISLSWASPTIAQQIIPQADLYPTLASPANLSAAASGTKVNLSWTNTASPTTTSFTVQRSPDGVNFTTIGTTAGTVTTLVDSSIAAATSYTYRVIANGGGLVSAPSATATANSLSTVTNLSALNWVSATAGYSTVQKNTSILGNPLKLRGVTYATGIGTHAASTIVYNLGGAYTTFTSAVGVDDEEVGKGAGAVDFQVIGDGKVLFDSGVLSDTSAVVNISVSVAGVQTLTLVANNAIAGNIDYDHSDWAGATLSSLPSVPAAPANVSAVAVNSTTINLAWSESTAGISNFIIQRGTDGVNFSTLAANVSASATQFTDSTALAGTKYYYQILAVNSVGNSPVSTAVSATTPAANSISTNLSTLNWVSATAGYNTVQKNVSIAGNPITLNGVTYASGIGTHAVSSIVYNLGGGYTNFISDIGIDGEEKNSGGSVDFKVLGDNGAVLYDSGVLTNLSATVSFNVNVAGVQTMTLVATNGVAGSIDFDHADWAGARLLSSATAAPASPSGLTAAAVSATQVNLAWANNAISATGFIIQRATGSSTTFAQVGTTAAGVTTFSDTTAVGTTSYTYRILATSGNGNSSPSATASATTFAAGAISTNLSSLAWVSATAGYNTVQKNLSIAGNPITLNGLTYATGIGTHAVSNIVYNLAGGYTNFLADIGIDGEEKNSGGSVDFKVLGDNGAVLYDSGILTNLSATVSINVNVTGVQTMTLVATNGVAGSIDFDHADWAGARLLSSASQAPAAPSGLVAVASSATQVNLTWANNAPAATGFIIQRASGSGSFATVGTTTAGVTTFFDTTAAGGTAYTYQVLATNGSVNSAASNIASATTLAASAVVTNLSTLPWVSATAGWNSVQTNTTVSGNPITLRGVTYASGLGTHAVSVIVYNLAGGYTNFISDIGVDDEELTKGIGSVDFQVIGDGKVLFDSGILTNSSQIVSINVNVTGVQTLTLSATNGVTDSIDYDHADWAGAKLVASSTKTQGIVEGVRPASTISALSIVDVTAPSVPTPWANISLGDVGQLGGASESAGVFTTSGAGAGLGGTADAADYVYQSLAGNGSIIARLDTMQAGSDEAGLLIREGAGDNAKEAALLLTAKAVKFIHRAKTGGKAAAASSKIAKIVPQWMKLVRKGNTFTAYDSVDGVHWKKVGSTAIKMNAEVEIGLAIASGTSASLNTAVFSDVAIGG